MAKRADRLTVFYTFSGRLSLMLGLSSAFISIYACSWVMSVWLSDRTNAVFFFST